MGDEFALAQTRRDHWHHFRLGADNVHRCHRCAVSLEQFRATERRRDAARQEEAQEETTTPLLMPTGTTVHRLYSTLRKRGRSKASAAKIAQAHTGLALATGKPPKTHLTDHWTRRKKR